VSKRRPVYLKAVDLLTLFLVGLCAASMAMLPFHVDGWQFRVLGAVFAVAAAAWFLRLVLAVRYLWTGRTEPRLRDLVSRPARPARPASP